MADLSRFEVRVSDDTAKPDPELYCLDCGERLCDVEHGDTLEILVDVVAVHLRLLECNPKKRTLECDHCGGPAIESKTGYFTDGDGEKCMTCEYPGHVSVCGDDEDPEENPVYWKQSEEPGARCKDPACEECGGVPGALASW